jgi:glycosyltransferase involved in cell wall biosynthesis
MQNWREAFVLNRVLQHPQLKTLFCLDPFAVKQFDRFQSSVNAVYLPDPVELAPVDQPAIEKLSVQLAIEPGRKVFLLFGALDGRKGIYQLLDALAQLPPHLNQRICLLLVGATNAVEKSQIQQKISHLCEAQPIQLIERYEFISETTVSAYFQLSDIVLAPYQRHVGMSGILLLAAAAGKPVVSSNYGLMGELVRQYQLGLAIDSTSPNEIANALKRCLEVDSPQLGDRGGMQQFVECNSVQKYTKIIFGSLLHSLPDSEQMQPHPSVSISVE